MRGLASRSVLLWPETAWVHRYSEQNDMGQEDVEQKDVEQNGPEHISVFEEYTELSQFSCSGGGMF